MIEVQIISGLEGPCLAINGTRVAGPKPWGGGNIIHEWRVEAEQIRRALPALSDRLGS